jgi:hypothetical protein
MEELKLRSKAVEYYHFIINIFPYLKHIHDPKSFAECINAEKERQKIDYDMMFEKQYNK